MVGVASAALWAAGCTGPKPSATPISRWEFDETSSAEGVFEDRGPAHVLMIHAGTWADLTTDPLVAGDDGTSAYTDGSAYATIPADVPAYNLAAITISFYYQRESASEKHILLAGGNGSEAGDFSIEVLPNGRLRAWHTGQDNQLRHFENTNGITGTDLQVGTAHRVDLSLGPQGARICLDGVELVAAAIQANTNGWNNARVKFLGRWIDGVQAPAVGVFDRLRIWNRQLTGAEIAQLEAARSITLPDEEPGEPGQPGDAPLVPSLAEWLTSDEPDPTPTKYVSNQNRGNGSGSSPANAQEAQAALNSAQPGHVLLAVCQTPGTIEFWNYPNGLTFPAGSSGNYITLQARQGDGVVISRGEDFAGARTPNSGFWTQNGLSADDINKNIWRSVATFPGGEQAMLGWWIEFDHPHQLLRYSNLTNLRAAYGQNDSFTNYATPGVHKGSDGRIYIRMQKSHPVKYSRDNKWSNSLWQWKGATNAVSNGQINYPLSQNPNNYPIYLTGVNASTHAFQFATGGWAKVGAGINSMGHRWVLGRNSHDIWCDRGLHYTWQLFLRASGSGANVTNYFMTRVRCTDGSKRHSSQAEWKFGGPSENIRSICFSEFDQDTMSGVYWKDCTIGDFHELFTCNRNVNVPAQIRLRNCTIVNTSDDGFQGRYSLSHVEIGYCHFLNADFGGMGGSGTDGNDPFPGGWYIHHNIFDARANKCINWRAQTPAQDFYTPHSPDGTSPRKIYNNLVIVGPDRQEEQGIGFEHCPQGSGTGGNNTLTGATNTHQMFNNIIMTGFIDDGVRYDAVSINPNAQYADNFQNRSDFVGNRFNRADADDSNELQDYNLYWRPAAMTSNGLLRIIYSGTTTQYASLAAWRASANFADSKLSGTRRAAYSPGWEGNSTDTKPVMGAIDNFPAERLTGYRPAPTAAVTVASNGSLNGQNWWTTPPNWGDDFFPWNDGEKTLAPSNYKGPLNPNGSTMPVGVRNP